MPDMPTVSAGDWLQKIADRRKGQLNIFRASLEFTDRCNYRCVHCYINQPAGDAELRKQELTLEEWKDILDQVEQAGIFWLLITGGEPLLRPDFPEFYLYTKRKGFHVTLFTNGSLVTPEIADLLARYPPWQTEITLYGATAETYESITGIPGSSERCVQGIELLLARGLTLNVKTMALTLNVHEIPLMRAMAERWGVGFRYDVNIHARLNRDPSPLDYCLSAETIYALESSDLERMEVWRDFCDLPWEKPDPETLFTCGAGTKTFHLDAYGGLYPCLMVRWLHYDLRAGSLETAISNFLSSIPHIHLDHDHRCRECNLRIPCRICPGWAYLQTGDPEAPDPFRCNTARLRQQMMESITSEDVV